MVVGYKLRLGAEGGYSGKVFLQEADEPVGGGIMGGDLRVVFELRFDLLGQLLA